MRKKFFYKWIFPYLRMSILMSFLWIFNLSTVINATTVKTALLPSCYMESSVFSLDISGTKVPVSQTFGVYEYAHYSFQGKSEVSVTVSEDIVTYSISPLAYRIEGSVNGKTLTFNLSQSRYLIIKINDLPELVIVADELEKDIPKSSGKGIYNIVSDYGADLSGIRLSTSPIQKAIDDANKNGGGIVYVPAGLYYSGQLILKSNVKIYMEAGSVIRATNDCSQYTIQYNKVSQGKGFWFIYTAEGAGNIKIYGRGTLDGNGHALRHGPYKLYNAILMPLGCYNFEVDGITFRDSGLWAVTLTRSKNLTFINTKHFNENDMDHENDAVDVQECQNVLFRHSIAISEDDTYSTKTWGATSDIGENWYGKPQDLINVVFDDCVAWSRCATFKVGFGVCQKQDSIVFKNSISYSSMRAIAVNHKYCPMPVTNVVFDNIDIEKYWPRKGSPSKWLDIDMVKEGGVVRDVTIKNIHIRDIGNKYSVMKGFSEDTPLQNITFENIYMPGKLVPAETLQEMNIQDINSYVENLKILSHAPDEGKK